MIKSIIQIIKSYWEMDVAPFFRIMLKSNINEAKHDEAKHTLEHNPSNLKSNGSINDFKTNELEHKSNADEMVQLSEMPYISNDYNKSGAKLNTNKEKLN